MLIGDFTPFHHMVFSCGSRYRVHTPVRVTSAGRRLVPSSGDHTVSSSTAAAPPASRDADHDLPAGNGPHSGGLPRRSRHNVRIPTMPWDGTTGTSITAAMGTWPRKGSARSSLFQGVLGPRHPRRCPCAVLYWHCDWIM